jgi:hypothetical protein
MQSWQPPWPDPLVGIDRVSVSIVLTPKHVAIEWFTVPPAEAAHFISDFR